MSRGFIKEGDQEEIPMVPPRAYLPEGVPNYVTKEGLEALREELKTLETERTKAGDNYVMGNYIDAVSKQLIERINSAVEIDLSKANKNTVSFGAWVRYNGRVVRIVGVDEADVNKGLISFISPIAKLLTGKKAGDVIELKSSGRTEKISVEEVSFEPLTLTPMANERHEHSPQMEPRRMDSFPNVDKPVDCHQHDSLEVNSTPQPSAPRHEERDDDLDVTVETEGPRRFEPEVNLMEFLPIVNERGNIMGRALYMEMHNGNKLLHPVLHLHVLNSKGEVVRRYWWHVAFGDTPEKTLKRKMAETLGISGAKPLLKRQYIRETKVEKELVYVFSIVSEENLPQTPEGKEYQDLFAKD